MNLSELIHRSELVLQASENRDPAATADTKEKTLQAESTMEEAATPVKSVSESCSVDANVTEGHPELLDADTKGRHSSCIYDASPMPKQSCLYPNVESQPTPHTSTSSGNNNTQLIMRGSATNIREPDCGTSDPNRALTCQTSLGNTSSSKSVAIPMDMHAAAAVKTEEGTDSASYELTSSPNSTTQSLAADTSFNYHSLQPKEQSSPRFTMETTSLQLPLIRKSLDITGDTVTKENFEDGYVQFITYHDPQSVADNVETLVYLKRKFSSVPKTGDITYTTWDVFCLVKKLNNNEIKNWSQLVGQLGLSDMTGRPQFAQRVKRWMHKYKIDCYFDYLLGNPYDFHASDSNEGTRYSGCLMMGNYQKRRAARVDETDSVKSADENNSVERQSWIRTKRGSTKRRKQHPYDDDSVSASEAEGSTSQARLLPAGSRKRARMLLQRAVNNLDIDRSGLRGTTNTDSMNMHESQSVEYTDDSISNYEKGRQARADETDSVKSAEEHTTVEGHPLTRRESSSSKKRKQPAYGDDSVSASEAEQSPSQSSLLSAESRKRLRTHYFNKDTPSLHEIANNDDADMNRSQSVEGNDESAFENDDEEEEQDELASTTSSSTSAEEYSKRILTSDASNPTPSSDIKSTTLGDTSSTAGPSVTSSMQHHEEPEGACPRCAHLEETVDFLQHDVMHLQGRVEALEAMLIKEKQEKEKSLSRLEKMFNHYRRWQTTLAEHFMQNPFESSDA